MMLIEFSIRYNLEGGFEQEALALARRLFAVYDTAIDSLSLIPSSEELFALYLNGQLVTSYQRDGRAPAVADIKALFSQAGIMITHRLKVERDCD